MKEEVNQVTKFAFVWHINGEKIVVLTTEEGKDFIMTHNLELIPLDEYAKSHPFGGNRQDGKEKN